MFRQRKTIMLSYSWLVVSVKLQVLWLKKKKATKPCNIFIDETLWVATLFLLPSGMYEGGTRLDNSTACILNHQIHSQPCYFFSTFSITALPPAIAFCSCLIETLRGKRAADSIYGFYKGLRNRDQALESSLWWHMTTIIASDWPLRIH